MNRSSTPNDGPGDSARRITLNSPAQTAAELLRQFHDIQSLSNPDDVITYFHAASAAWEQCASGSHYSDTVYKRIFSSPELERQANLLDQTKRSCVSRMVSQCLEKSGAERRTLHRKFTAAISQGWTREINWTLKKVPLWLYWGSWR